MARPERLQLHLEQIAADAGIEIEWIVLTTKAESYNDPPLVLIPRPTTLLRYLVGLHELGHILYADSGPSWSLTDLAPILTVEVQAWAWAFENALPEAISALGNRERVGVAALLSAYLPWPDRVGL